MEQDEIKERLRQWIAKNNGRIDPAAILDDTPILEQRIVSSLHTMDLILYVERLRSRPVSIEEIRPGAFRDIKTIYASFFTEAPQ